MTRVDGVFTLRRMMAGRWHGLMEFARDIFPGVSAEDIGVWPADDGELVAYNNRAKCYFDLKDDKRAISDPTWAIELKPEFADAFHTRGRALERLGRSSEAIEDYRRTVALDATHAAAERDLRRLMRADGR
jgi:tetratricopeptide (TPR) repeat protein